MRIFIALDLADEIKDYLYNLQKEIGNNLAKIKWVEKKNLHLTLKFLGEVSEEKVGKIKEILKEIKFNPFKVELDKIGVYPNENYARVIWIGLKPETEILRLQKEIDSKLLNLFPEEQRFETHLTIGRVKFIKNKEQFKKVLKEIKIKNLSFYINEIRLYKSTLTRNGPIYDPL